MRITVTESITRECCQPNDLKNFGITSGPEQVGSGVYKFCRHCGRTFRNARYPEWNRDTNSMSEEWVPLPWPWQRPATEEK